MYSSSRSRTAILISVVALLSVLIPASLAIGADDGPAVSEDSSVVLLTLGPQDRVTWNDLTQVITTQKNDCTAVSFASSPQLLVVNAHGGSLGEVKDGLGVLSANDGAGEPCGRVDADNGEAISVVLGSALDGYLMSAVDVDLELKFGASVRVSFLLDGDEVAADPVLFAGDGSDDGPDSKDGDNYRYFYEPMSDGSPVYFDEVSFTPETGALSLEGGADLASNKDANAFGMLDPSSKASQFRVHSSFDGEITCGDVEPIGSPALDPVYGVLTVHSMHLGSGDWLVDPDCVLKPFNAAVAASALSFVPELAGTQARYTIDVTATGQAITVDGNGQITSLIAEYDPEGDLSFPGATTVPLQACLGEPVLSDPGYDDFWTQEDVGLLPSGESSCFYSATVSTTGPNEGTEYWGIYFEDDPSWSFK